MHIDDILHRLENVRKSGDGYSCRCPAHQDRSNSMTIRETDDGVILLHCFAGCTSHEITSAVGINESDLFPPRPSNPGAVGKPLRNPFPAMAALKALSFDACFVAQCAITLRHSEKLPESDIERLTEAAARINAALSAVLPTLKKRGLPHA
jgi:hypothetical protein